MNTPKWDRKLFIYGCVFGVLFFWIFVLPFMVYTDHRHLREKVVTLEKKVDTMTKKCGELLTVERLLSDMIKGK